MAIEKKIDLTDAITSVKMPGVDEVDESIEVEVEGPQALEIAKEMGLDEEEGHDEETEKNKEILFYKNTRRSYNRLRKKQ